MADDLTGAERRVLRSLYYDKQGQPIGIMEWVARCAADDYRRVGDDRVDEYRVSTVLLGLDHQHANGPPLIFETMVFNSAGDDSFCDRYSTLDEAETGHALTVELLRLGKLELYG